MATANPHPPARTGTGRGLAVAAAVLAFLLFAGQFVLARHGLRAGLGAGDIVALRFGTAAVVALPFLVRWGLADLGGIGWRRGALLALVAGAPYFALSIGGLAFAPAANAVVINPAMTLLGGTLLSALWLAEPVGRRRVLAAALALVGLTLLGGADIDLRSADAWIGNLMFALSGLVWALYMALLSRWRLDPVRAAVVVAVLSAAFLPVYPLLAGPDLAAVAAAEILIQGGYQGLVHALCAIALFSYAVRRLGVAPVALMTPIVPVAGLIMAAMWLGERLSGWQSLGAALVCGAMVLAASQALRPGRGNT